ncbi:hypothetical protein [Stieleria tagensis]|uniref:hypothetical protein n=1 Tax=Stieleria tagensis TaxID=2956795 RepID=UPI00209B8FC3|nr:hypothetical protein [Stieleria tagensis]
MMIAIAVIMGASWFGSHSHRGLTRHTDAPGHAFGSWTSPQIDRLAKQRLELPTIGMKLEPAQGYDYFSVRMPQASEADAIVAFINRNDRIVGRIQAFDPEKQNWPPQPSDFGDSIQIKSPAGESPADADSAMIDFGPSSDFRIQVQTILYDAVTITWASPRKSPAWPQRMHVGKCLCGERELLIQLYEIGARTDQPDYQSGPIAALANSIHPS